MKTVLIYFVLLCTVLNFKAQDLQCGTDSVMSKLYQAQPNLRLKHSQQELSLAAEARPMPNSSFVIPVVVHVLHLGGPENISDEQVRDAIRILNRDFAKMNPDTAEIIPEFKAIADSSKIQFELAKLDPGGNCTNGIHHYYTSKTDWNENAGGLFFLTWDPTRYLNIYIVRSIELANEVLVSGYSSIPGFLPPGHPNDAIVILNGYTGSIGTSNVFLSRVLTHEVGHWLGLYHVFEGMGCAGSDLVSDTPPTNGFILCPNITQPGQYQICTSGQSENFQNYMDYSYCVRMFTQGQVQKMQSVLTSTVFGRNNLSSTANLQFTGISSPTALCVPSAEFRVSRKRTCVGTPVLFTDQSWLGAPNSFTWQFQGGLPAVGSTSLVSVTYTAVGSYSASLISQNSAGPSYPILKNNVVKVIQSTPSYSVGWSEGFENSGAVANDWDTYTNNGGPGAKIVPGFMYSGLAGMVLTNGLMGRYYESNLESPLVHLANTRDLVLSFQLNAVENNAAHRNSLSVYASVDCGLTWNYLLYHKYGSAHRTRLKTSSSSTSYNKNDWRLEVINLSALPNNSDVMFKFVYKRDSLSGPNAVAIDDINLQYTTGFVEHLAEQLNFKVFPVPAKQELKVTVELPTTRALQVSLFDLSGRELLDFGNIQAQAGNNTLNLQVAERIQAGFYILKLEDKNVVYSQRILIE